MAATLTDELTRVSVADIEKWEDGPDGTLYVYGRCTTPEIDTDDQVVDSSWSGSALKQWLATAPALRVQHNPQRDPAGSGVQVDVDRDGDGAHWLKAAVDEPGAQRLVRKKHLRAFSVGIARPIIERDVTGKARGGVIRGGQIVEVSLVDSPANRSCFLELAKAASDGTAEWSGKVGGSADLLTKVASAPVDDDLVNVDLPKGASISISPADLAKLHTFKRELTVKTATTADKRDVSTAERRQAADAGHALADGSYPIETAGDLHNAAHLARTGHGDADAARALISRRARELGVANPLDDDSTSKGTVTDTAAKAVSGATDEEASVMLKGIQTAMAVEDRAAAAQDAPVPPVVKAKKPKKPKKMPPWMKPDDDGSGDGNDADSCKGAHAWVHVGGDSPVPDIRCEKCKTTPAEAAGLSGTHDMQAAPVPDLLESPPTAAMKASPTPQSAAGAGEAPHMDPVPQHREPDGAIVEPFERDAHLPAAGQGETPTRLEAGMMKSSPEVAAILRFKAAGIDVELGRLHDLTCPAYHPEDVSKCHPFADLAHTDEGYFQRKAVEAACGPSLEVAKSVHLAWQAAHVLKEADPGLLNDYRLAAHKAFRDANPGPGSAPTPGMVTPGKYNRPLLTDGREASSSGHDGPNTSPVVATTAPDAHGFDRPPLEAGHQSPSPSHMKASFEYPSETGRPMTLNYAVMEKERARQALMQMHEHLSRQFPEACPMSLDAPVAQPESRGVPATAGVGKSTAPSTAVTLTERVHNGEISASQAASALKAESGDLGEFADAEVYKGFKKMRKKLGKKVLAGKMTVDEARTRMGRQFAQKGTEGPAEKSAAVTDRHVTQPLTVDMGATAELIKAAVAEALHVETVPLEASAITAYDPSPAIEAAVTKAVTPLLEKIQAQDTKLAETQRVIDAIADQPDPGTAAFSGLAFNPLRKSARPAGVPTTAEIAERTQQMMMRHMQDKYNASSDPAEREAYYSSLCKMRGIGE